MVYMLFAFLAGGFVIGLLAERTNQMDLVLAAVMTLSIDMLSTQGGVLQDMFLFSVAFQEGG